MRSMFKVLFYVKKGSEKPNATYRIMCRLTVDREIKQFSCNGRSPAPVRREEQPCFRQEPRSVENQPCCW